MKKRLTVRGDPGYNPDPGRSLIQSPDHVFEVSSDLPKGIRSIECPSSSTVSKIIDKLTKCHYLRIKTLTPSHLVIAWILLVR